MASSTVAGAEAFADALAKSGLVSADALAKVREAAAARPDAKSLARDLVKDGTLTRWQAAQLLHGYHTLTIGKYRLLDQLGTGETGRVYVAQHVQMNRRHALKILSRRQTAKPDVLKRFLAEAQRVCALDHRNLSHVYDVNQDGDKYFLVMEYVEGEDLKKRIESSGPLPAATTIDLMLQAIEGLIHAHEKQVVHGDLKPTNLNVDAAGTLKITDIGQARLVEAPVTGSTDETTEAAALSAALFRAPELREGKQAANVQSDVYSLGNVLCFVLTGKAAKDGADAKRMLGSVKSVTSELVDLCVSMLSADPGQRPRAMSAVQSTLRKVAKADVTKADITKQEVAMPSASPMPKAKKPPVAKAIATNEELAVVVSAADDNEPVAEADNPLAGLSVQPPRPRGAKPAVKVAASRAESVTPAQESPKTRNASQPKKSMTPVIIVAALGGGLLLLGGVAVALVMGFNWAGRAAKDAKAVAVATVDKAAEAATAAANEKAIEEALAAVGEMNPAPPAEANPDPTAVATTANATPPAPPAATSPTPAAPAAVATEPAKPAPMSEPAKPEPSPAEPARPELKPEPAKPEPPALKEPPTAEPAKPAPPKPAAAATATETFKGLPTTVTLPKLEPGMTDPPPDALATLVIGPCSPDATAQLKGGAGALRGGKTTFELVEGKDDQSLGKWDVVMTISKTPLTIAQLSVQNKQLAFQWTADGAKHESAPYLANCKLVLSVGADQHEIALREPLKGESLLVDLEKPGSTVKWTVEHLPDPRKIVVEISRLGEAFPAHKFDPSPAMEGTSAETLVWTGADPENTLLGVKFESSQTAKFLQVKGTAQFKQGNSAKPLLPRTLKSLEKDIDQTRLGLINSEKLLTNQTGGNDAQKKQRAEALKAVKQQQEEINLQSEQLNQLQQLIAELKDKSEVHFRVYYQADDSQVDLVVADHDPPKEKKAEQKRDDGKKKAK